MRRRSSTAFWVTWCLLAACRYAPETYAADNECRDICSDGHATCVRNGEAAKWGLPGVTYDLCRQELEACIDRCRPEARVPVVEPTPATAGTPLPDEIVWSPEKGLLRCPWGLGALSVPRELADRVRPAEDGTFEVDLRPAGLLVMLSRRTKDPLPLDDLARAHARLTGEAPPAQVKFTARAATRTRWEIDYRSDSDASPAAFRAAVETAERPQGHCRLVAVERADAPSGQGAVRLLTGFWR